MKHLLWFWIAVIFTSCTTIKYIPVKETEYVTVRDSVYFRDTLIKYSIEKEYVKEYAKDTLRLSTSYSEFEAYQDTLTGLLAGTAKNKDKIIGIPVSIKEKVSVKDSIVYKEIPIEIVKEIKTTPRWAWYSLIFSIVCLLVCGFYAYIHLKP